MLLIYRIFIRPKPIIKKELNKEDRQKITITEFCAYFGLNVDQVQETLAKFYTKNNAA
jgi:hypothetical protein